MMFIRINHNLAKRQFYGLGHTQDLHRLSQFGAYFFHPSTGINAVHNPAKETQPLGNIVAVETNVFFARPDIERQEILHAGRLGEKIGCMPELWCLHHHSADIEDVFISEQIEPPRPLRQLLMKETVVLWP